MFKFYFGSTCIRDFDSYIKRRLHDLLFSDGSYLEEHFALFERKNKSWFIRCMYYLNPLAYERVYYPNDYKGFIDDTYFNNPKYDFDGLKFILQEQYDFAVRVGKREHV